MRTLARSGLASSTSRSCLNDEAYPTLNEAERTMRLFFHHIIKTAGISVRSFIVDRLGEPNVTPTLRNELYRDAMRDYARFAAIVGHVLVQPGDGLGSDRLSVVFLRDPVERALSQFSFMHTTHTFGRTPRASGIRDIDEWLDVLSERERHALNAQVDSTWGFGWRDAGRAPSLEQRVKAAMRALDEFAVVGLQEHFDESLAMLAARAGWAPPSTPPRTNVTPNRMTQAALSDHARGRLRRYLEPDDALYRHALQLFGRQRSTVTRHLPVVAASEGDASRLSAILAGDGEARRAEATPDDSTQRVHASDMTVVGATIRGEISGPGVLQVGETAVIELRFESRVAEDRLAIGVSIRDAGGSLLFATDTARMGDNVAVTPGAYAASFRFANHLGLGSYRIDAILDRGDVDAGLAFDRRESIAQFDVVDVLTDNFAGRFHLCVDALVVAATPESRVERKPISAVAGAGVWPLRRRNPILADFRARIVQDAVINTLARASDTIVRVTVTNLGAETWPAFGRRPVRVAYHWLDADGGVIEYDGIRSILPRDVGPGESIVVDSFLRAPELAGERVLAWTLLQEEVVWFAQRNPEARLLVPITITP
jgi:hypothetical protein